MKPGLGGWFKVRWVVGLVSGTPSRCSVPRSRSNDSTKKKTEALSFNVMFHNQRVSNCMSANKVPRDNKLMYTQCHYTDT